MNLIIEQAKKERKKRKKGKIKQGDRSRAVSIDDRRKLFLSHQIQRTSVFGLPEDDDQTNYRKLATVTARVPTRIGT